MTKPYIWPLAEDTWGDGEEKAVLATLSSGRRSIGEQVAEFEAEFAEYIGTRFAVMTNSGSSANLLAVAALRHHPGNLLPEGSTVLVPALAWSTTYAPLIQYGLKLAMVDIDPLTLCASRDTVMEALGRCEEGAVRAFFAVHILGAPCFLPDIIPSLPPECVVLEDCCESLGTRFGWDRYLGTFGTVGTYSFYFAHQMTTGEGGMAVTNDENLYRIMRSLRSHGWTRDVREWSTGDSFTDRFYFVLPGYNFRPMEIQAAVGRVQLQRLKEFVRDRRANYVRVHDYLKDKPFIQLQGVSAEDTNRLAVVPAWMAFAMTVKEHAPFSRFEFKNALEEAGIETRPVIGGNFMRQPMVRYAKTIDGSLPTAQYVHDRGVMIGNPSTHLTATQLFTLRQVLERYGATAHELPK